MKTVLTGLHELDFESYRAIDAINKSGLDQIAKSPAHFRAYLKSPPEPSMAMVLGTATHYGVFQPELLHKHFFARPEGIDGRTKEGKERLSELGRQNAGKTMLTLDEFRTFEGMMKAVRNHAEASKLIAGGRSEMSAICQDPEYHVMCKARPDYLTAGDAIIDLKTASAIDFRSFQRSVVSFRYHVQAAWYLDTVNAAIGREQFKRFLVLAIEREMPHGIMIYQFDADAIRVGRMEARTNLKTYVECKKTDQWPGYPSSVQLMTIPEWA